MDTELEDTEADERAPGRGVKLFVGAFLGLFLLSGLVGIEAWPITSWKLYSKLRHGEQWSWQVVGVDRQGAELAIPFHDFPAAYHGVNYFLGGFDRRSADEQHSACLALGEAARSQRFDVDAVRLYKVRNAIPTSPDSSATSPPHRVRNYECSLI